MEPPVDFAPLLRELYKTGDLLYYISGILFIYASSIGVFCINSLQLLAKTC